MNKPADFLTDCAASKEEAEYPAGLSIRWRGKEEEKGHAYRHGHFLCPEVVVG